MDAPEALLQSVGVPRQVVVHHQVRALQVDALAGCVGGEQHLDLGVVQEALLRLAPLFAPHAAVDQDDRLRAAEQRADLAFEVAERVAVLGEEDELLARRGNGLGDRAGAIGDGGLGDPAAEAYGREDLAEQVRELTPLGVLAAAPHFGGEGFETAEGGDLRFQFSNRCGRRGLVEDPFFSSLHLVLGRFFEIFDVVGVEHGTGGHGHGYCGPALQEFQLAQPLLQALAPAAQRLVDRLRRRGETPLQDGERKADRSRALVVLQRLRAVELLTHVLGDFLVEARLGVGELVGNRVGDALGEERPAVELEQVLLHHAAHQVGDLDLVRAIAKFALEAVAVEQCHEELEVLFLAVVRRGRHQQEVTRKT